MRRLFCAALSLGLLCVMAYSGARLWALDEEVKAEQDLHARLLLEKPAPEQPAPVDEQLARLREQNPDIVGWITVPYTNIDYPIVQARDNDYYLRRDLDGNPSTAGTIFMDFRCAPGGSYGILYGHNMRSGKMFGSLREFRDPDFFQRVPCGTLHTPNGTFQLQFFAFVLAESSTGFYYKDLAFVSPAEKQVFLDTVKREAGRWRDIPLGPEDRVVALSTCLATTGDERILLLAKLTEQEKFPLT